MGKTQKLYLNYEMLKQKNTELVANADDNDLMILSALALIADIDGIINISALEAFERFEKSEITASIKFWRGAGIITASRQDIPKTVEASSNELPIAHKSGAITHTSVGEYTNEELTNVIEIRVGAAFIDEAQSIVGKMFNKAEINKLVGIVDQLGFEKEAVLAILAYVVRLGKKSISYAEKIAITFHDDDIFTAKAVHAQIDLLEKRASSADKIKRLFGFGDRTLSASEKKMFASWTEEYGFDFEIIKKAYEITVDTTSEAIPKYTDKILKTWYENGLKEVAEIDAFIESEKNQRAEKAQKSKQNSENRARVPSVVASSEEKGKEIDEWFEAKLLKMWEG